MTGDTNYNRLCLGCSTYLDPVDGFIACNHSYENYYGNFCPCARCIVKMMCEEPCLDFDRYVGDL